MVEECVWPQAHFTVIVNGPWLGNLFLRVDLVARDGFTNRVRRMNTQFVILGS